MKYLIFFLAAFGLACATWSPRNKEQFYLDRDECIASEELSKQLAYFLRRNRFGPGSGCYYRCIGLKAGIWDDIKGYDLDRSLEQIAFVGLKANKDDYSKCLLDEHKDADPCKWALNVNECLWSNTYVTKNN